MAGRATPPKPIANLIRITYPDLAVTRTKTKSKLFSEGADDSQACAQTRCTLFPRKHRDNLRGPQTELPRVMEAIAGSIEGVTRTRRGARRQGGDLSAQQPAVSGSGLCLF